MQSQPHYDFYPKKEASLVLASFSGGQPIAGVDMAPARMLDHGVQQQLQKLGWKVTIEEPLSGEKYQNCELENSVSDFKNLKRSQLVGDANKEIFETVKKVVGRGEMPITLGGDHSVSMGSVSAILEAYPDTCVLWIDAHGDINTPSTTPSGNLHGCPISFLMGLDPENTPPSLKWVPTCLKSNRLAYIGLRDIDDIEKEVIREKNICAFSMYDVELHGLNKVIELALKAVNPDGSKPIHISYDIDAIDPLYAPATGLPVNGGLTLREGLFVVEKIARTGKLVGLDIVECNPVVAKDQKQANETIDLGCAIARRALGETLL